jgi:hypothetical protein
VSNKETPRFIRTYSLEEIETILKTRPLTIKAFNDPYCPDGEDYVHAILRKNATGYECDFIDEKGAWCGQQWGRTLVELLLLGVFGAAQVEEQTVDDQLPKPSDTSRLPQIRRMIATHHQENDDGERE